jgi:hypothetical protein
VGGGVGEKNFLSHRRERTANSRNETGLADATGEREDGEDRGAGLLLTYRRDLRLVLAGLLEDSLEREPAGGDALARVLKSIGDRRLTNRKG